MLTPRRNSVQNSRTQNQNDSLGFELQTYEIN